MTKTVYYAEPIDFATFGNVVEIETRTAALKMLMRNGASIFRPATAWVNNDVMGTPIDPLTATQIEGVNREALERADLLVARLPQGVDSHGVPMEIEFATRQLGIPAIVHTERAGVSLLANPLVTVVTNVVDLEAAYVMLTKTMGQRPVNRIFHTGNIQDPKYAGDAGYDLRAAHDAIVPGNGSVLIPTASSLQIPEGLFGWVVARSSTFRDYGLLVLPGIIDEEYTGELYVSVYNPGSADTTVEEGERIAQIVLIPNMRRGAELVRVDKLEVRERGANGFGSTND